MLAPYNLMDMRKALPQHTELLLLIAVLWLLPDISYATSTSGSSVADVLCKVGSYLWGPVGAVMAMLGVVAIGIIAMFGKIQITSVLTVMAGIGIIFGAPEILNNILPSGSGLTKCVVGTPAKEIMDSAFFSVLGCTLKWFLGPIGKTIGTLSLIAIGVFATYGRISWHQALLVATGMATMFGTTTIVHSLGVPVTFDSGGSTVTMSYDKLCSTNYVVLGIEKSFCAVYNWFNGSIGRGIATTGMIILGLGALFGKVSWIMTMVVAIGIALIFGAGNIVIALGAPDQVQSKVICHVGELNKSSKDKEIKWKK